MSDEYDEENVRAAIVIVFDCPYCEASYSPDSLDVLGSKFQCTDCEKTFWIEEN